MTSLAAHFQNNHRSIAQDPCPSAEEMADSVAGVAPLSVIRSVVDHCSRCPKCAQDWRTAKALLSVLEQSPLVEASGVAPPPLTGLRTTTQSRVCKSKHPPPTSTPIPRSRTGAWALAGLAAAAALLLFWERSPSISSTPTEIMRGSSDVPSSTIGFHASGGVFRWPDFQPGSEYELSIFDASGQRIFTLDRKAQPQQTLSQETMRELSRKGAAFWQVLAVGPADTGYNAFSPAIPWPQ